jgi:phosphoglycerate dehydrogenase-like enzyme
VADIVVDLLDRRPIWAFPAWGEAALRDALPRGWTLHMATRAADGSGDGVTGVEGLPADLVDALGDARVYLGFGVSPAVLEAAPNLVWAHSGAAGVGSSLHPPMRQALASGRLRFTNSAGIHGPPMAETVLGMLLYFFRGFDLALAAQREARWGSEAFYEAGAPIRELGESTVGILGYGGIGRALGARIEALGGRVRALRRGEGIDLLEDILATSDAVVLTLPETPETVGLLSATRLALLRPGAVFVNVARGGVVDEEALIRCLTEGRIRGAGLDVFATEPLPVDSPLWHLPNVLLTPHVSAVTRSFWKRELDLVVDNLGRLRRGEVLRNEVAAERGY